MVAAYSACHAGRDTYDAYGVSDGEYLQCYGDKYAEGTPAGTRSEAEEAADKEYYGRQEGLEALGRTLYGRSYVCASPEESVIALRDQAQVSISIAGTMALKPSGSMPIISEKLISLRS